MKLNILTDRLRKKQEEVESLLREKELWTHLAAKSKSDNLSTTSEERKKQLDELLGFSDKELKFLESKVKKSVSEWPGKLDPNIALSLK